MKSHIWRPLYAVVGIVVLILIARVFVVPKDFGVHERGYMYGWYNKDNENYWKDFKVKFRTSEYCKDCHSENNPGIECVVCHNPHKPKL
ncbi:MAG: hypothetical protein HY754_09985 [Nitrospirae bacterium]|nr:hypothetical protein [Nitrospirota bacterium]